MTAFPRSVFSEPELDATRWFAQKCGVENIPSVAEVKAHRPSVLEQCGANPTTINGRLGDVFSVLDLKKILADVRCVKVDHISLTCPRSGVR
jgi:hypothetical protein